MVSAWNIFFNLINERESERKRERERARERRRKIGLPPENVPRPLLGMQLITNFLYAHLLASLNATLCELLI